jgi:hypothetical protein
MLSLNMWGNSIQHRNRLPDQHRPDNTDRARSNYRNSRGNSQLLSYAVRLVFRKKTLCCRNTRGRTFLQLQFYLYSGKSSLNFISLLLSLLPVSHALQLVESYAPAWLP